MNKYVLSSVVSGFLLLGVSVAMLYLLVSFFPHLAEEYYNPVFRAEDDRNWMFYLHPFILSFALGWFWHRFRSIFSGQWVRRAVELGFIYLIVAIIPIMWITFSAIDVPPGMVFTWVAYGFGQSLVAGLVFARLNP